MLATVLISDLLFIRCKFHQFHASYWPDGTQVITNPKAVPACSICACYFYPYTFDIFTYVYIRYMQACVPVWFIKLTAQEVLQDGIGTVYAILKINL